MPHLHPDPPRLPANLHSEQEVLVALRMLPPEAHVFARLNILDQTANRDREIDFLVAHPDLGLMIIEVKGQGVEPKDDHWIRRHFDGREERLEETPGEQLQAQQWALLTFLQQTCSGFIPKITRVLALPALPLNEDQSLGPDLPACRILTRSKLRNPFLALREAVTGGSPWATWRATPESRHYEIRPDQLTRLLNALTPGLMPLTPLPEILAAEGRLQDAMSRYLLDHLTQNFCHGRFHVQGGPGSGKSLLARQAARVWASEGRRVLLMAYNRALTYATQNVLDDLQTAGLACVTTYHDLAANLLIDAGQLPEKDQCQDFFGLEMPQAFSRFLAEAGPALKERWDALIIDEAQDLDPTWITPLLNLLQNPNQDPVLLLEDPAQSIFRQSNHDLGQPWRLDLSLRQHPAIRRAACQAFPACGWESDEVQDPEGVVRRIVCSKGSWKRDLAHQLEVLSEDAIAPEQVIILAPHRPITLGLREGEVFGPWALTIDPDWWDNQAEGHVRIGTVQGFKGLEADVVIYLAPGYRHPDAERLAYTAYSRARHRLIVLDRALPEPLRPKSPAPVVPKAPPVLPPPPAKPDVRSFSTEHHAALMGALTAARTFRAPRNG
jgi:AAA domain/Nuclease-related domain/UvrD-like helicase C-terminal domain